MALIKSCKGINPQISEDCYLAENCTIIGDVVIGKECSIWFLAVIRGDVNKIRIGNRVNVQDGAILHCTYKKTIVEIGNCVSIGHRAILHGCKIHDNVLIGMGAIVMDNVEIHSNSIIAANSVVLENTVVEAGYLYAGVPAKKIKKIDKHLQKNEIERIANNYIKYSSWFKEDL